MKKFITYALYVTGLLLLVHYGILLLNEMRILTDRTFNPVPSFIASIFIPIVFGFYLALPEIYKRLGKSGYLAIDWMRVLVIGIPTFLINISMVLFFFTPLGYNETFQWLIEGYDLYGRTIIGVFLGYNLLIAIDKVETYSKLRSYR